MYQDYIVFELPTHPLPKIALRLECLLNTIIEGTEETSAIIHHYALNNILETIKLIEKPELKSRFLKEMMRIEHQLTRVQHPLDPSLLSHLSHQIHYLSHAAGRFGKSIRSNLFLQSIRPIQSAHSADCELHSPQLKIWLLSHPKHRQNDLINWVEHLRPLHDTVMIYLSILRATTVYEWIYPKRGFYQRALPPKSQCHLITLHMPKEAQIIPRMQLGHYGFSLRLHDAQSLQEIHSDWEGQLELGLCHL